MGTHAWPAVRRRLAAIIKASPGKPTGEEGAFVEDLPPSFGAHGVTGKVHVVGAHVSFFFVFDINAARTLDAGGLAADRGQLGEFLVKVIDVFAGIFSAVAACAGIVEALNIHDVRYAFPP